MVKAALLRSPHGRIRVEELDEPTLEPGAALLDTICSEVCGTDLHLADGRLEGVPYPIIPGHISVGTISRVCGEVRAVDGRPMLPGNTVTFLDVHGTCNHCWFCLVARAPTKCPSRRVYGVTCSSDEGLLGGWAEKIYLRPGVKILHLPHGVTPLRFIAGGCALPTALHAVERARISLGDVVVVQGAGPVGMSAAISAKLAGARKVVILDKSAARLKAAERFDFLDALSVADGFRAAALSAVDAATDGRGADVVIEATGVASAVREGLALTRDGGRYVVVGQYTDGGTVAVNPHLDINRKGVDIRAVWGIEFRHLHLALQVLAEHDSFCGGKVRWEDTVGGLYDLEDVEHAMAAVRSGTIVKAVICPNGTRKVL